MFQLTPRSINDMLVTVTSTATLLYTLVDTASATQNSKAYYGNQTSPGNGVANVVSLRAQDGDVRIAINATPTATKGFLIPSGTRFFYQGDISALKLIRTGSADVAVEVGFWVAVPGETVTGNTDAVTLTTGDLEIGAVELKNGASDLRAIINPANTARAATDNVLLVQTLDASGNVGSSSSAVTSVVPGTGATNLGKAEDAVHTSGDVGTMALGVRKDTAVALASDGDYQPAIFNSTGHQHMAEGFVDGFVDNTLVVAAIVHKPLPSATYAATRFQNIGANATLNVKASTGNIFSVYCHNLSGADRWLQLHNTATTPGGGAVPALSFYIPAGGVVEKGNDFFTLEGTNFATGIAFACSTTEGTYTAATATDHFTQLMYI